MIAKLISWGKDREDCINKLQRALAEFSLTGIKTNILLHRNILAHKYFLDGTYTNHFVEQTLRGKNRKELSSFVDDRVFLIAAAIHAFRKYKKRSEVKKKSLWKNKSRLEKLGF